MTKPTFTKKEKAPVVVIEAKDSAASMINPPQLSATDIDDDDMCAFQLLINMSASSTYSEENEEDAAYALKILAEMERNENKLSTFTATGSNDTFCSERQAVLSNTLSASNRQIREGIAYSPVEKSSDGVQFQVVGNMKAKNNSTTSNYQLNDRKPYTGGWCRP